MCEFPGHIQKAGRQKAINSTQQILFLKSGSIHKKIIANINSFVYLAIKLTPRLNTLRLLLFSPKISGLNHSIKPRTWRHGFLNSIALKAVVH